MKQKNLIFEELFSNLRQKPKLGILIALTALTASISGMIHLWSELKFPEHSAELFNTLSLSVPALFIITILLTLAFVPFTLGFVFLLLLAVARIMKSDVTAKTIFSGSLLAMLIISVVSDFTVFITLIANLNPADYTLTSLNIFDPDNDVLSVFDLQTLLKVYVLTIFFYATCKFKMRYAIIWSVVPHIILIAIGLMAALL